MPDVAFVCVRKDLWRAEALAAIFDRKGFSIGDATMSEAVLRGAGAIVVMWSERAADSSAFVTAMESAREAGNAVIASSMELQRSALGEGTFDISAWNGSARDPVLAELVAAVTAMVTAKRPVGPVLAHQRAMRA
jgi:hypothetical protein